MTSRGRVLLAVVLLLAVKTYGARAPGSQVRTVASASTDTWTDLGVFASGQNNTSEDPYALTTSATLESGNVGICIFAVDNDGDSTETNEINLPTDSAGNLWVQDAENEADPVAGAAGAFVGIYHTLSTATLASGGTITFDFNGAKIAKAVVCREYSVGTVVSISTAGTIQREDAAGDAGSLTLGSLSSAEYLWIRAIASEAIDGSIATPTVGWSVLISSNGGSGVADSSSMSVAAEYIKATGTTQTSDPTMTTIPAIDRASVLAAFKRN